MVVFDAGGSHGLTDHHRTVLVGRSLSSCICVGGLASDTVVSMAVAAGSSGVGVSSRALDVLVWVEDSHPCTSTRLGMGGSTAKAWVVSFLFLFFSSKGWERHRWVPSIPPRFERGEPDEENRGPVTRGNEGR